MERRPTRARFRQRLIHKIIVTVFWLTVGFGVGVIATLKAVGFS